MRIESLTENVRIGEEWPYTLDIEPINGHSENGVSARFFLHTADDCRRVEFRKKARNYCLFIFRYMDEELPKWWRDSKLLWSLNNIVNNTVTDELDAFIADNGGNARDALNVALARLQVLERANG